MSEIFTYKKEIFLKDLTMYGNTYFSTFFDWQGEAREALLKKIVSSSSPLLKTLKLVTLFASVKYKGEANYSDIVTIEVSPSKLTLTTVELNFIYRKGIDNIVIAEGHQRIGFTNQEGNVVPLPRELLSNGKKYLSEDLLQQIKLIEKKLAWISEHSSLK